MYIAICDDQYDDVIQIENALLAQGYEVEVYETGESLLVAYEQQGLRFDALFLDLKLQTMEGFDLANAIYAIDDSVLVVFVTAYSQYVFECFKCNPVWFLRKPINSNELNDALAHLAHRFKRQQRVFSFKDSRHSVRLRYDEILYFEAKDHRIHIHTTADTTYTIRQPIKDLAEKLDTSFCRISKRCLINLSHLTAISHTEVTLTHCATPLPLGRAYRDHLNQAFLHFKEEEYSV